MKIVKNIYKKNKVAILFFLIFFVAVFFRTYKLASIPFGLNNDAAWEGSAALDILKGNLSPYLPYAQEGWRGEGIIRIFVALFMTILGNNPITIRLASVVFGIGLVIPVFFLIKNLFDNKIALLTSFFIAISGWHITMSKTGWRTITVPFFSSLLFYFFFKSIKSKKTIYYALSGIFLSISSLYTYDAGRVILPFFICWLLFEIIVKKDFFSQNKKGLLTLFFSFIIFSLPMILYASNNWENFISRSNYLFVANQSGEEEIFSKTGNNILTSLLLFNVKANGNDFFIFEPLIDKPLSWFIPLGFVVSLFFLYFRKQKNYSFIVLWFLAGLLPGILSSPNGNRALGTVPAVYFFSAAGLLLLTKSFEKIKFLKNQKIPYLVIFTVCLYSAFITYENYLGQNRRELPGFYPETLTTSSYIKQIRNNFDIYLTDNFPRELLTYYLYKEEVPPFSKNYVWLENHTDFLEVLERRKNGLENEKGAALFMFPTFENGIIAQSIEKDFRNVSRKYLFYKNEKINRAAALVLLIPSQNYNE